MTQRGRPTNVSIWFGVGTLHSTRSTRHPTVFEDFVSLHGWRNEVGIHSFETPWKLSSRNTRFRSFVDATQTIWSDK